MSKNIINPNAKITMSTTYGEFGHRIAAKEKLNRKYAKYGNQ